MRGSAIAAIGVLLLAACGNETAEFGTTGEASPTEVATAPPPPTTTVEPTATQRPTTPTSAPTLTPEPTAASAFAETDECTNEEYGWTVTFPESWWTNTAFTHPDGNDVAACWMFSPDEFDPFAGDHANATPPGVDVRLQWVIPAGLVGVSGERIEEESVTVSGYDGTRIVWRGTAEDETTMGPDDEAVQYVVEFPSGAKFMAWADSRQSDDFDHAVEVLDGMMERIDLPAP